MTPDQPASPGVLVTGGARRIGREIASDLARAGWRVVIHHNSSQDDAHSLEKSLRDAGGEAVALQCDLSDWQQAASLIKASVDAIGPLTCLINNASLFEQDEIESLDEALWQSHIAINLRAPVQLAQAFAAALPAELEGNIINIIDQRVWRLTPKFFSYTISKAALWTATQTLAQGLAPRIRVNAIGPGPTMPSPRQSADKFDDQQRSVPLQRGPEVDEIIQAVRFILDAHSMTGQMIALDGGQHLAWKTPDIVGSDE